MCKEEKTQNFQSRIVSSCFCFGPFVFSGFSCDLFGLRFGYFSFEVFVFLGRTCRYSLELFVSLKLIEDYIFPFSLARGSLSSRNDEKQNSYILELRKGRVECPSIGRVICLEGIVLSSLDANETRKRDLWSCQQDMVCWWCLKFNLTRTRVPGYQG